MNRDAQGIRECLVNNIVLVLITKQFQGVLLEKIRHIALKQGRNKCFAIHWTKLHQGLV